MTDQPVDISEEGTPAEVGWDDPSALPVEEVRGLVTTLTKALRAYQLYDENNPVYQRFVSNLRNAFREIWTVVDRLQLLVEEDRLVYFGEEVYRSDTRTDSLAFLLYKDGIRDVTFLPGIEDSEVEPLLNALQRARHLRAEGDDLVTILWDADLQLFRHTYVDVLAEGLDLPEAKEPGFTDFTLVLEAEVKEGEEEDEDQEGEPEATATLQSSVSREDFNPTLYSLDAREMEQIGKELEREMARDVRGDVLDALFDRLEEPDQTRRQDEILEIVRTLLPNFLSHGALRAAADVLEELNVIRGRGVLDRDRQGRADRIIDELSAPESVQELVRALQDGSISPGAKELGAFLKHLRATALGPLVRAAELVEERQLRPVLREAVREIAAANRPAVLGLLGTSDGLVVAGAVRLAGHLRLTEAGPAVARLLAHGDPNVRLAAVESALGLRTSTVSGALPEVLEDEDREVRIAAARAIAELRYLPAAPALRSVIKGKRIRQADLTEKIAFFESYGVLGDRQAAPLLDKLLNGRGFLGRRETPEIRACAALALGRIGTPEAGSALEAARGEQDPVIRNAVNRALRGEASS